MIVLLTLLLTLNKLHTLFQCLYCYLWTNFTNYSSVFINNFEQILHNTLASLHCSTAFIIDFNNFHTFMSVYFDNLNHVAEGSKFITKPLPINLTICLKKSTKSLKITKSFFSVCLAKFNIETKWLIHYIQN